MNNKITDNLDDELLDDELLDDELLDDELEDYGEYSQPDDPKFGEAQFEKTLDDKDYYTNRAEELQKKVEEAEEEKEKDTMTIPPEEKDGENEEEKEKEENTDESSEASDSKEEQESETNEDVSASESETTDEDASDDASGADNANQSAPNEDGSGTDSQEGKKQATDEDNVLGKDSEGRPIVAKNADGSTVVEKNKKDHKRDAKNLKKAQAEQRQNKINETLSKAYAFNHPIEAAKRKLKANVNKQTKKLLLKALPVVLPVLGFILLALLIITIIVGVISAFLGSTPGNGNLGYTDARCPEITVTGQYAGTYDLETYVAGVVQREVGFWNNLTVDEVFAVAARSYGLANADDNCTIENSTSKQTFTPNIGDTARQAADNTKGIIIVDENGNPKSTQYDAFAEKSHDANYYILKQRDQKIPTSWVESHISPNTLKFYKAHHHGNGISQWGALYLATVENKGYMDIIKFYLGDVDMRSTYVVPDLDGVPDYPLNSSGSIILRGQQLDQFLASKGTSLEQFNALIASNVNNAGYGSRAGVVTAAVTLIGELNKYGVRIPYFWGGGHSDGPANGALAKWGGSTCHITNGKNSYIACGLDCSGFVSWALNNGGVKVGVRSAGSFKNIGGAKRVELNPSSAVLKPGDILESSSHAALVVAVNSSSYITAEASGNATGVLFQQRSFAPKGYWGVDMSGVYGG